MPETSIFRDNVVVSILIPVSAGIVLNGYLSQPYLVSCMSFVMSLILNMKHIRRLWRFLFNKNTPLPEYDTDYAGSEPMQYDSDDRESYYNESSGDHNRDDSD